MTGLEGFTVFLGIVAAIEFLFLVVILSSPNHRARQLEEEVDNRNIVLDELIRDLKTALAKSEERNDEFGI